MTDLTTNLTALLSKYKKVYFLSFQFIISFTITINKHHVLLRLMYKSIHQTSYKYRLFKLSRYSDFDKEIPQLLYDLYEKQDHDMTEDKPLLKGILKTNRSPKKTVTFQLPPIKEDISERSNWINPLRKNSHPAFHTHLIDPRSPQQ